MKKIILFTIAVLCYFIVQVNAQTSTNPAPYCVADFDTLPNHVNDYIKKVELNSLVNASNSQCPFPHYILYDSTITTGLIPGIPNNLFVDVNVSSSFNSLTVWIDLNRNNIFEQPELMSGNSIVYTGTEMLIFTIPFSVTLGLTRMRIRLATPFPNSQLPCNQSALPQDVPDNGETEDYQIYLGPAPNSVQDYSNQLSLNIYPNPSKGIYTISSNEVFQNESIKVMNLTGQIIYQKENVSGKSFEIDISTKANGIYFVEVKTKEGINRLKVVKH
jgi:hypothetical protein